MISFQFLHVLCTFGDEDSRSLPFFCGKLCEYDPQFLQILVVKLLTRRIVLVSPSSLSSKWCYSVAKLKLLLYFSVKTRQLICPFWATGETWCCNMVVSMKGDLDRKAQCDNCYFQVIAH